MSKLRKSARWAPHCMFCGLQNHEGNMLCLAHANTLSSGKGMGLKGRDEAGAILCNECHNMIDGRTCAFSREEKQEMHRRAHLKTMEWWVSAGFIKGAWDIING